jgi:hypothetical protein
MNTLELSLLASELASARTNATLGASHVDQVRRVASISGDAGLAIRPLHLAKYHFDEAAKLIDQALGKEPQPAVPQLADYIAQAKQQLRGSRGDEALTQIVGDEVTSPSQNANGVPSAKPGVESSVDSTPGTNPQNTSNPEGVPSSDSNPVNPVNPVSLDQ